MEYKLKRQIIFGAAVLILAGGVIIAGYNLLKPKASCSDGILNQNEEQVDCGGLCQACKVTRFEDIKVLSYNSFLLKDGSYDAYAEVKNPNISHGTESLSYTFSFYDSDKKLIGERAGKGYVLANQTRYIIESNIQLSGQAAFTGFIVNPDVSWQKQEAGAINLPVFSQKYEPLAKGEEHGFAKATGVVENQTEHDFDEVEVDAVLVDKNNQIFAAGKTQIDNLRFGESRAFSVLFLEAIPSPSNVYITAHTNIFNPANMR